MSVYLLSAYDYGITSAHLFVHHMFRNVQYVGHLFIYLFLVFSSIYCGSASSSVTGIVVALHHRRQGKDRRFCLGIEFIQLLAALAVLHQDDIKTRMNCTRMIERKRMISAYFKSLWWKIASAARNSINFVPQTAAMTFALSTV